MIKVTLFDTLTVGIFDRCILNLRFDTSRVPFSFDLKLGLFYSVLPWFNKNTEYDAVHNVDNNVLDIICPVLFDLRYYEQIDLGYDD